MSDVQDTVRDQIEGLLEEPVYPSADKKILFGFKKPTEDAVPLGDLPLLIEAPFPSERTIRWTPECVAAPAKSEVVSNTTPDPDTDETAGGNADAASESSATDTSEFVEGSGTTLLVTQEVLLKVNEHVSESLERELGGFLLGNRYRCPNTFREYVVIDQFSPAKFTEATEIQLKFTHEAWAQLSDELSGKFLGKLLVGWYHSHPRMDVFLSSHDMEIQVERFSKPWMTALVLEPEKHRGGFFCARDGWIRPHAPVEFFELLERNSRESVVAWENYSAVDPLTNGTPVISAKNTANSNRPVRVEALTARANEVSPPRPRRRRRLITALIVIIVLTAGTVGATRSAAIKLRLIQFKNRLFVR